MLSILLPYDLSGPTYYFVKFHFLCKLTLLLKYNSKKVVLIIKEKKSSKLTMIFYKNKF